MEFADRLGWVALIMAFLGLAITILWPTKRWIGWLSLSLAVVLGGVWGWLEFRAPSAKHEIEAKGEARPNQPPPPQPGLTGIQKTLDEINKNLARTGRPQIHAAQMDVHAQKEAPVPKPISQPARPAHPSAPHSDSNPGNSPTPVGAESRCSGW